MEAVRIEQATPSDLAQALNATSARLMETQRALDGMALIIAQGDHLRDAMLAALKDANVAAGNPEAVYKITKAAIAAAEGK